ncbi:MAG TPA: hypothetical protein VN041_14255, partial [Microbacterium sp.]|nr:hypothetical protein [Microbacterium sp.]
MLFEGGHGSAVRVDVDVSRRDAVTVVAASEAPAHLAVAVAVGVGAMLETGAVLGPVLAEAVAVTKVVLSGVAPVAEAVAAIGAAATGD